MKLTVDQPPVYRHGIARVGGAQRVEPLESRIAPALASPFLLGALNGDNGFSASGPGEVGDAVSVIGDVNGDGFDDVLIAAFGNSGAGYVIFGKAGGFDANVDLGALNGTNGFAVTNPGGPSLSNFATTAGAAGDLNGDGFADFAVGADSEKIGANNAAGAVYVVFGKATFAASLDVATLSGTNGFKLTGVERNDAFGTSIAPAGDLNSDGFGDLVVTASGANGGINLVGKGAAFVVFGKASGFAASASVSTLNGTNGFKLVGENASDGLSIAAAAGDVNGDGFGDLILGAAGNDAKGTNAGSAYVVFGKAGAFAASVNLSALNGTDGFKLRGEAAGDSAGYSVSSAGDVNGDGFSDLLIGAAFADRGADTSGAAYVVFGKGTPFGASINLSSLDGNTGFKLTGTGAHDATGYSVAPAGDVNGDGFDDVIIGSLLIGGGNGGAYVVYGKAAGFVATTALASLQVADGFPITGTLGYRVGGAGDVNGDGLDDVIIGSRDFSRAYVVFGFDTGAITHPGDSGVGSSRVDLQACKLEYSIVSPK